MGYIRIFRTKNFITLLVLIVLIACKEDSGSKDNEQPQKWFKGNLHTHSYWSDGDEFPEVILDWYKKEGYNFVALSDHNTLAEGEKWITIKENELYQDAFKAYFDTYGDDWVVHKSDSGKTQVKLKTFEEYRGLTEEAGKFLVIESEEITDKFEDKHLHMNATNIQKKIEPQGGTSVANVLQNNIDQVLKQREETGVAIMPHINHPNFFYSVSLEDMKALNGERFFEVYNGHPMVHNMGDSVHISTEEMWDLINISYLEKKKPIMYGLATDDSHHYHQKDSKWSNAGRGWVMVQADTLSAISLIDALENGKFYATTGVELEKLNSEDGVLTVSVTEEAGVSYTITFMGSKVDGEGPEVFSTIEGTTASFTMDDEILFVRCKVTSTKLQDNPVEGLLYEMAWTQPLVNRP